MKINDGFQKYMQKIAETPLLTRNEEASLAKKIRGGDSDAHDHLVRANLRLVVKIARDYEYLGLAVEDLVAEGNTGLMKAAERFDAELGKFSTYAAFWIKQAIRRALANQSRTVRLPVHAVEKLTQVRAATRTLEEKFGREPSIEELAEITGIESEKLSRLLDAAAKPLCLDAPVGEDGDRETIGDIIADSSMESPGVTLSDRDLLNRLDDLLVELDARERVIIDKRFGLDKKAPRTLEEVGQEMGVTRERIRQLQNVALKKMRRALERLERPSVMTRRIGGETASV